MDIQMEKVILDSFVWPFDVENWRFGQSQWQTLADIHSNLVQSGYTSVSETETLFAIYELMVDRSFDCFEDDPRWGIFKLAEPGLARRRQIANYFGKITFSYHDGRFVSSDGIPVGCVWIDVRVNGVNWGRFPKRYTNDINANLKSIRRSLCLCRRSDRQILYAIRQEFGGQVSAT